jgi:hypothetical protein
MEPILFWHGLDEPSRSREVIKEDLLINQWHGVALFMRTVRLGLSLALGIRQPSNKTNAIQVVCKMFSRRPQEIVELLGVNGVTQGTIRKLKQGRTRIGSDTR